MNNVYILYSMRVSKKEVMVWKMKFITLYFNNVDVFYSSLNTFLPMCFKFSFIPVTRKVWSPGADELFKITFSISLMFELFLSQENINVLEKMVVKRPKMWGVYWKMNFVAKFVSSLVKLMVEHCVKEWLAVLCWPVWDRGITVFNSFWEIHGNMFLD